ncbi:MAG: hypothetical protein ACFCUN_14670 [Hyphomicrobiaceae bacterium]
MDLSAARAKLQVTSETKRAALVCFAFAGLFLVASALGLEPRTAVEHVLALVRAA